MHSCVCACMLCLLIASSVYDCVCPGRTNNSRKWQSVKNGHRHSLLFSGDFNLHCPLPLPFPQNLSPQNTSEDDSIHSGFVCLSLEICINNQGRRSEYFLGEQRLVIGQLSILLMPSPPFFPLLSVFFYKVRRVKQELGTSQQFLGSNRGMYLAHAVLLIC